MPRQISGKKHTDQFSIRVPEGLRAFIERDVEENQEHLNRNDWIISAIEHYKAYRLDQLAKSRQITSDTIGNMPDPENVKKSGRT